MAMLNARLVFVLVFVLNCLLWSQSRYANVDNALGRGSRETLSSPGLIKRLIENDGDGTTGDQCKPSKVKFSKQCHHAQNECPGSDTVLSINYTTAYFCTTKAQRPFAFASLLLWLGILFSTLGISSSEFFCPNLSTLSNILGLDESVAGVTFLAFGNGSPDVFSTFAAMRSNTASLAIGELLGAASFIVSVVLGSMCFIKPFTVEPYAFLRDTAFFTFAVALIVAVMWDGRLYLWETMSLVGVYVLYVLVVIIGTWWSNQRERRRARDELVRQEYAEEDTPHFPYTDEEPYQDDASSGTATPNNHTLQPNSLSPHYTRMRAVSNPNPHRQLSHLQLPPRPYSRSPSPVRTPLLSPARSPGHSPSHSLSRHSGHIASFSLVGALEFRDIVAGLQPHAASASLEQFETSSTPFAGGYYNRPSSRSRTPTSRGGAERDPWDDILSGHPLSERTSPVQASHPPWPETPFTPSIIEPLEDGDGRGSPTVPEIFRVPPTPRVQHATPTSPTSDNHPAGLKRPRVKHALIRTFEILFPNLNGFFEKSTVVRLASLFAVPAVLALTLTLPVVATPYGDFASENEQGPKMLTPPAERRLVDYDPEADGVERTIVAEDMVQEEMHDHLHFNKWLMAAQCVFGPLFCAKVVFDGTSYEFWALLIAGISGFAMSALVGAFADDGRNPAGRLARCLMGFFVAVVWIMAIADEVVNVLQTFGFIFGLSHALIGLTIFAMGNSLADLVANISVAAFAPMMGFSACFGGPMLNMLLGVGLSGTYIISQTQKPYDLKFSRTLVISSMQLLVLLVASAVVIPLNNYHLSRQWGITLIISYIIVTAINVGVELHFS